MTAKASHSGDTRGYTEQLVRTTCERRTMDNAPGPGRPG